MAQRSTIVAVTFALVVGISLGLLGVYYLLPEPEGVLAEAVQETQYPVVSEPYGDPRSILLDASFSSGSELYAGISGIVTSTACIEGQALRSGEPVLWIDDNPIVGLSTETPFYRDLIWGEEGNDVVALRGALAAIGFDVAPTGAYEGDVVDAVALLAETHGLSTTDGSFLMREYMWLPASQAPVATCEALVGQMYASNQPVAKTDAVLLELAVSAQLEGKLVAGERQLDLFGAVVSLPETGSIIDAVILNEIASMPSAQKDLIAAPGSAATPIFATSALTHPLEVAPVPVTSVYGVTGDTGCVQSSQGEHRVMIIASRLGMSLVTFEGNPPSSVLINPEVGACG